MSRWYDKYAALNMRLEAFKEMDQKLKDRLVKGMMALVNNYDPNLLSYEKAFDFPLTVNRQRWYDQDPYLWLLFNTLKMADATLLRQIEDYLAQEMQAEPFAVAGPHSAVNRDKVIPED